MTKATEPWRSVDAVRVLCGHSKLDVTARYVHASGDELRGAIATLGAAGNRPPRPGT